MDFKKTYDLKVGYTCNNHCIHCVIETNALDLKRKSTKIDSTYAQLIEEINSEEFRNAGKIVLTGGEITIRRDFMRIVQAIVKAQPNKEIHIQTNARNLKPYVKELKELSNNIFYIVAVHSSTKELHDKIVGNQFDLKSPYTETMEAIHEIIDVYGSFDRYARIEIVLSKYNYFDLPKTIKDLHQIGVKHIGVSYPHLDGFLFEFGVEKIQDIGMSYESVKPYLYETYCYLKENKDIVVEFEEVPPCMWRDNQGKLLPMLPNLGRMAESGDGITVKFPGQSIETNFSQIWDSMHKQAPMCSQCAIKCNCKGVWHEAVVAWGDLGFVPITDEEMKLTKMGGTDNCSY